MPTGEDVEEVDLENYIPGTENSNSSRSEAYAEDDEECYFGGYSRLGEERVQCAHQ